MADLIVHVGTHKTATTFVQETLFAARGVLAEQGVIYPALGQAAGHHGIVADDIALPPSYRIAGGGLAAFAALADRWADTDRRVILSSEEFSRIGPDGGQADIEALGRIAARFGRLRVVALVRPQWQFLQSVHAEIARSRPAPLPGAMVEAALRTGRIDGLAVDYRLLHAHLRRGFPAEVIRMVDFNRARQVEGGILGLFLGLLGLSPEVAGKVPPAPRNSSPNPLAVWAAQMLDRGGMRPDPALIELAARVLAAEFGDRPATLFTRNEIGRLRNRFGGANAALARVLGRTQPHFRLDMPQPAADTLHREEIGAGFWLAMARAATRGQAA